MAFAKPADIGQVQLKAYAPEGAWTWRVEDCRPGIPLQFQWKGRQGRLLGRIGI